MSKFKRVMAMVITGIMMVGVLAGCAGTTSTSTTATTKAADASAATTSTATSAVDASAATTGATKIKVAIILKALANEHWVAMKDAFTSQAAELGIEADIYAVDSESDMQGQLQKFEDALGKGYQGIAFAPISPVNLIPTVVKANEKGIIVVNYDEKIDATELNNAGGYLAAFVTTDNEKIGEKAGQLIVDKLGASGGEVAIIEGLAGNATSNARKTGVETILKANTSITIVGSQPGDWDRTKAMDVATNMMQSNPDLKAFYCCNDTMALGVLEAVTNAGKKDQIIVVGTDGVSEAVQSVADGGLTATVAQDPVGFATKTLAALMDAITNQQTGEGGTPADVFVDSKLITK